MFLPVVDAASDAGVDLIGRTVVGDPFGRVVDVAPVGGELTSGVFTVTDHEPGRVAGGTREQALLASQVDGDTVGIDHGASHVAGERGTEYVVRVELDAVGGFAAGVQQRRRVVEQVRPDPTGR